MQDAVALSIGNEKNIFKRNWMAQDNKHTNVKLLWSATEIPRHLPNNKKKLTNSVCTQRTPLYVTLKYGISLDIWEKSYNIKERDQYKEKIICYF